MGSGGRRGALRAPDLWVLDEHTAALCRLVNDFQAEMVGAEPDRFRSFFHVPVHDSAASRAEFGRWRGHPGVAGVLFGSNMRGIYPGDARLLPGWEVIADARLPVFVHPISASACFGPVVPPIVLFPCDKLLPLAERH